MSLRRMLVLVVGTALVAGAAVAQDSGAKGSEQGKGGKITPPVLESGEKTIKVDSLLTKQQENELLADEQTIFTFVSKDTKLPIVKPVKSLFLTRDEVNKDLRTKFDEDKSNKRMERSELVLKKFGLLDQDFALRPFLLSLLTEQIAGFYDNKAKTLNLLNWVPIDEQKPVMAHELTHALQDQYKDLEKWEDPQPEGMAKNVQEDNLHIQTDEAGTVREAVLEGQAMVSFADKAIADAGHPDKTLKDMPQMADMLANGAGDMSDSPVLARAPLILQESLLFPYTAGLIFEQQVLVKRGTDAAFKGMLDAPPSSTMEIMHPDKYLAHVVPSVLLMPDLHPMLKDAGYEPYDVGVMGELDVKMTAELFGGKPLADALAPAWDGGIYYAAQKKDASAAQKATTSSLGLVYLSRWKNADSAMNFLRVFQEQMPRQYEGLKERKDDEKSADEIVYSTKEGDVLLARHGNTVWVSEGFDLALSRKLEEKMEGAQGTGPMMQASTTGIREQGLGISVPSTELLGGLSAWMNSFGVMKAALK